MWVTTLIDEKMLALFGVYGFLIATVLVWIYYLNKKDEKK